MIDPERPRAEPPFSYAPSTNAPRLRGGPPPGQRPHQQPGEGQAVNLFVNNFPLGWMEVADAERKRQGFEPKYSTASHHNVPEMEEDEADFHNGSEHDGDVEDQPTLDNTPSRSRHVPDVDLRQETASQPVATGQPIKATAHRANPAANEAFPSPAYEPAQSHPKARDRFHIHQRRETISELERPNTPQPQLGRRQTHRLPMNTQSALSKVPSLLDSSSDEEMPRASHNADSPRASKKRPYPVHELDFDAEELQKKTIADLDCIPFSTDPRTPRTPPAVNANGTLLRLSDKLMNLTKMRPEDQVTLFKSLNDDERELTATWFLETFQADTKKLITVRAERRKIALKYETEVKKREKQVQTKKQDVENVLQVLRNGGAELVKGSARMPSPAKEK
jgi:hypothetical protein